MDNDERDRRCVSAKCVGDCDDCSFDLMAVD